MLNRCIGIRSETKNRWERRTPLTPTEVRQLVSQGIGVVCQPSPLRIHTDAEYQHAGARISSDLSDCAIICGVKEIPPGEFEPGRTYLFFSHTHKGQPHNMPMLEALMDRRASLIDYELITDDAGRRQISFGFYAGLAGMIDSLWALGRRYDAEGFATPLLDLEPAWRYHDLEAARAAVVAAGRRIAAKGLHADLPPLVAAIAGRGNSALGAQEIYDLLPTRELTRADLARGFDPARLSPYFVYRVPLGTGDLYERIDGGGFDREEYRQRPALYRGTLEGLLPRIDLLVHAIYWEEPYPRLVTRDALRALFASRDLPRLRLIADISCDVRGSVEATIRPTTQEQPTFLYLPEEDRGVDTWTGRGPLVLATDNLPCELPREASHDFGRALAPFLPRLVAALEGDGRLDIAALPASLRRATIVCNGRLTEPFSAIEPLLPRNASR